MSMTTQVAQLRISRELLEAEQALSDALIRGSQLFTTMVTARRDLGLVPTLGHEALLRLNRSQQAMLAANGDLARVHGEMIGIGEEVTGTLANDCPAGAPMHAPGKSQAA